jgi:CRISPR-associated exonuclease Cas4
MGKDMELQYNFTATHLLEYLYCPRFTYFEYVLDIPERQEQRFKVLKGRKVHEAAIKINKKYLRKKLNVVDKQSDIYLSNKSGLRGIIDEILFFEDGTVSPLDFKYAKYKNKIFKTHRFQLLFYAKLIIENYNKDVKKGYIVFTRSKNKLIQVDLTVDDFKMFDKIIDDMSSIVYKCIYPDATKFKMSCLDCCYKNICES